MTDSESQPLPSGIIGVAAVLAALAGVFLWTMILMGPVRLGSGLAETADRLERAEKKLSVGNIKGARVEAAAAVAASERARSGWNAHAPLLDVAKLLPVASDALSEVDHFVNAADYSSEAAFETVLIADEAIGGNLIKPDPDDPSSGSVIDIPTIEGLAVRVHSVRELINRSAEELAQVDPKNLPERYRSKVTKALDQAAEADKRLGDAEDGFAVLPGILGVNGARTYLLGFQNNAEQRGSGGAILQFSTLTIDNGRVQLGDNEKHASTVYDIDKNRQPFDIPLPDDAWLIKDISDAHRFGNANWSPNWPMSAELMIEYAHASEDANPKLDVPDFDGFFAVDPFTVQKMMPGVGPFAVNGNRLAPKTVVPFVLYGAYGKYPYGFKRRLVLRQIVNVFFKKVIKPTSPTTLVEGAGSALSEKRIQIWMKDAAEEKYLKKMGWDGGIKPAMGADYIYAVEQNVGGNKFDYFAKQATDMTVAIDGLDAHVSTELSVTNNVFLPQPRWIMGDCQPNDKQFASSYCHGRGALHKPMLSLYVPLDAELENTVVTGQRVEDPLPAAWTDGQPPENLEAGKKVWSATLVVPQAETAAVRFDYTVPGVVKTKGKRSVYRLVIQHQPKVNPETMTIRFTLPEGATWIKPKKVEPHSWVMDKETGELVWTSELKTDMTLEVAWRS